MNSTKRYIHYKFKNIFASWENIDVENTILDRTTKDRCFRTEIHVFAQRQSRDITCKYINQEVCGG